MTDLGVRVVRRFEAQVLDAHLLEENAHEAYSDTHVVNQAQRES